MFSCSPQAPRFDFFRVSCSWFHLHHSDILVKRHSSTSEQIEWASTTVQEWHRSRLEFTELNSELVCVEHLTVETLEQADEIRCYRIIAWTKTVSSHQAIKQLTSFISHSCIRHEVCANHVGRLYDVRAWVLMGSRSAVTLGMWKSTWRCESQPGDVETWDPRAFHSFHILPSVIWRIKAVTVLLHSFTRLAWWLWDHHAKCPWCWSGAWWSHQPSSNKGNGVDHPIYGFTWIHGLFFSPPGIFHVYFGGFLCGKTTALLGWHETYGVPFGQNEGWRSGTVKHYSAEINIESLEWLLLLYHLHSLIVDSVDYIG